MGSVETPLVVRHLGGLEKSFAVWNHLKIYYNIGITGYYVLQPFSSIASLEQTIYAALSLVIHKHPILSTIITDISTCPSFARLPSFDLQNVVSIVDRQQPYPSGDGRDIELDKLLERPHNEAFENETNDAPFWRLLILTNPVQGGDHAFTASFVYHHAIADGTSGLIFHKHFLAALNSSPKPLRSAIIQTPKTPLLPELEKLHPFPVSFPRLVKAFFEDRFPSPPRGVWAGAPSSMKQGQRRFRSVTLSPSITTAFTAACKNNGTTLQATLQVLAAASLFSILPEKFRRVDCNVVVSLRRSLDEMVVGESMGTFSSSLLDHYDRNAFETAGFRWNEAHRSRDKVAGYYELKGKDDMVGLLKHIKNYEKHCWSKVGKPRVAGLEINNAGTFEEGGKVKTEDQTEEEESAEWKMGRMIFSQSAGVLNAAIMISVVIGGDGGLTLGFAWQRDAVDNAIVDKLMEKLQVGVEELAPSD